MTRVVDNKEVLSSVVIHDMAINNMIQLKLWVSLVSKFRNRTAIFELLGKDVVQSFNLRFRISTQKRRITRL